MLIKVITVNSWEGGLLFDNLARFLRQQSADVVMLQEMFNAKDPKLDRRLRATETLREASGLEHADFVPLLCDPREGNLEYGNAVFSRYPITTSEVVFPNEPFTDKYVIKPDDFSDIPHGFQHVVLATPAGELQVYNVHGPWDLVGERYNERRRRMSEAIARAVKGKKRVVLAGDTNAKPVNKAFRDVEKYLVSVFGDELATTYNLKRKDLDKFPGYASAACDMMFASRDVRVVEKACPAVDVSDHLPLVATLEI